VLAIAWLVSWGGKVVKDGGDVRCQGVPQFVVAGEVVGMREAFEWIGIRVSGAGTGQYCARKPAYLAGCEAVPASSGQYRPVLGIKTSVFGAGGARGAGRQSSTGQ
jgi:hypothetical protein